MKHKLEKYVGRIVRLNQETFQDICRQARHQGEILENCFVVAKVGRGMHNLVCYGANLRIIVGASDVALI